MLPSCAWLARSRSVESGAEDHKKVTEPDGQFLIGHINGDRLWSAVVPNDTRTPVRSEFERSISESNLRDPSCFSRSRSYSARRRSDSGLVNSRRQARPANSMRPIPDEPIRCPIIADRTHLLALDRPTSIRPTRSPGRVDLESQISSCSSVTSAAIGSWATYSNSSHNRSNSARLSLVAHQSRR